MSLNKDWTTDAGLRAVIVWNDHMECYCGYVCCNKYSGVDYDAICGLVDIGVHGGLTYSDRSINDEVSNTRMTDWWFGFDCAHSGDTFKHSRDGVFRTAEFVENECETLASQLAPKP